MLLVSPQRAIETYLSCSYYYICVCVAHMLFALQSELLALSCTGVIAYSYGRSKVGGYLELMTISRTYGFAKLLLTTASMLLPIHAC
jgi:hypothetical protein